MTTNNAQTPPAQTAPDSGVTELLATPEGRAYLERAARQFSNQDRAASAPLPGSLREAFADGPPSVEINGRNVTLQNVTLGLVANLTRINSPLLEVIRILREELSKPDSLSASGGEGQGEVAAAAAAHQEKLKAAHLRIEQEIAAQDEQIAETVFCFLHTPAQVRELLDRPDGRIAFRNAAMAELGDVLHPTKMAELQNTVAAHYSRSFSTVIGHGSGGRPSEGGEVFIQPPPAKTTGSAGGSASSAS